MARPASLETPRLHRLLTSPLGRLLETDALERVALGGVRREFGISRARSAADVSLGHGPAAFLDAVGAPPAPDLHPRIERALAAYATRREAFDAANERWEEAFWGPEDAAPDDLVEVERERRAAADRRAQPTRLFRFLATDHLLPPVKYDVPTPEEARHQWEGYLATPERLYGFDGPLPTVERSQEVRGPGTVESFLRFESPSPYFETATARVYEPETADRSALPTLVFNHGLGMMNDTMAYWPPEAALARPLAREGFRVVLPDAPWHGRREMVGTYSGEHYLAKGPIGMFQLFSAAALENGVLVDWARTEGAPAVAVGGLSLGGITTLHVVGHCGAWPESTRPDLAFPVAGAGLVDETVVRSELLDALDTDKALRAAGWTPALLGEFGPLLNPPTTCGIDPERVVPVAGVRDEVVPYDTTRWLLDSWGVPDGNRVEWDVGHFGVLMQMLRHDEFRERVKAAFATLEESNGVTETADVDESTSAAAS
ncbi:hypothetical protein SAMN04487949_2767 [Halogranum gelatinilyticum]|uniref:Alpha/beta hydrolase family protein n=1 Tax=Halogranum gelatinilyticum TaxID=660521 RepID=A0A1G9WIB9_9EURY|nr:alpha/beta hydrolase [Halogranum gelatinilyticum]SDM84097.1 hypothetical protein SAMN04487949_2767 [Halogranum gelatinilyticum]